MNIHICKLCHAEFNYGARVCRGCGGTIAYGASSSELKTSFFGGAFIGFFFGMIILFNVPRYLGLKDAFGLSGSQTIWTLIGMAMMLAIWNRRRVVKRDKNRIRTIRYLHRN